MVVLIKIVQFLLSLSLLVLVHEFGHFIFARIFGMRVEKFYIFLHPWFSIFKIRRGDTEYGLGWLPLGGYCKIAGMIDESMDTEQMKAPPKPDEFRSKPAWQRLLVMTGGVIMNVVLAMVIFIGISYAWGESYIDNRDVLYGYTFNEPAREIGFRNGDKIVSVNGEEFGDSRKIINEILLANAPVVVVERDGVRIEVVVSNEDKAAIIAADTPFMTQRLKFTVAEVIEGGGAEAAGIRAGDRIIAVEGNEILFEDQLTGALKSGSGTTVEMVRISEGATASDTLAVNVSPQGTIGIVRHPLTGELKISRHEYTLFQSLGAGVKRTGSEISDYWRNIKLLFTPKTEAYKSLGGMVAIGNLFPSQWSWQGFWGITAFLSIILAVMNLLPIPALDGGHTLFLLAEIVSGRRPSDKFLERAQVVGMIIILALLLYANSNDIYRFFIK